MKLPKPCPRKQKGSAMLEMALIAPVFLALVIFLIDTSRYFTQKNIMTVAAQKAIAKARIHPNLSKKSATDASLDNEEAIEEIVKIANSFIKDLNGNTPQTTLLLPLATGTLEPAELASTQMDAATLDSNLTKYPLEVTIQDSFSFILSWLPNLTITTKVIAYREPKFTSSMPVLIDCKGNRVGPQTNSFSANECPCGGDPNAQKDLSGAGCICRTNSQSWWNIHSQYKDYMPLQENAAGACSSCFRRFFPKEALDLGTYSKH